MIFSIRRGLNEVYFEKKQSLDKINKNYGCLLKTEDINIEMV